MSNKDVQSSLTEDQFAALKEVADKPTQCAIPEDYRDYLIASGYIREVRSHSGKVYGLVLTARGKKPLARGGYFPDRSYTNEVSSFDNVSPKKDVRSTKQC